MAKENMFQGTHALVLACAKESEHRRFRLYTGGTKTYSANPNTTTDSDNPNTTTYSTSH